MLHFYYADNISPTVTGYGRRILVRPLVVVAVTLALASFGVLRAYALYATARQQAVIFSPAVLFHPVESVSRVAVPAGATRAASAPVTSPTAATNTVLKPQACKADTFAPPSLIDLTSRNPGVTQVVDPVHYYRIYGYNGSDVRQQIINCAPKLNGDSEFTGYTSFRINWRYSYGLGEGNACELLDVKVGMHIGMALPSWQESPYAVSGFAGRWRTFIANLTAHEQGHVTLDEQYATAVLTDLQNFSAPSCDGVQNKVDALVRYRVNELNSANDNYDATTNHGATQGAVLPE